MNKIIIELKKYAELECSEYGEFCRLLLNIYPYSNFCSDSFRSEMYNEIEKQLNWFKNNMKIVEKEQTYTIYELEEI